MGFFSEENGKQSAMRLMCFISLVASVWFGYLAIRLNSEQGVYICSAFLLSAFAPKAVQKFMEAKKDG